jgi:hypothetical protein
VAVKALDARARAFDSCDSDGGIFQINIGQLERSRFLASQCVAKGKEKQTPVPRRMLVRFLENGLYLFGGKGLWYRLEQLLNQLATIYEFDLLCAYPLSAFHSKEDERVFQSICAEHSAVYSQ